MPVVALTASARSDLQLGQANGAARIGAPVDGTIFALDPDIPATRQRIGFERAGGASARTTWRLDGKTLGRAPRIAWLPWPGSHLLELLNADGSVADAQSFLIAQFIILDSAWHQVLCDGAHRCAPLCKGHSPVLTYC